MQVLIVNLLCVLMVGGRWNSNKWFFCSLLYWFIGRDEEKVKAMEEYLKATKLFRNFSDKSEDPIFSEVIHQFFLFASYQIVDLKMLPEYCCR